MRFFIYCKISLKYLWRYRRRYLFLFLALGFGFGVLTVVSSLKDGMKENLYLSAQSHYAGDIIAQVSSYMNKAQQEAVFAAAKTARIDIDSVAIRNIRHGNAAGTIFFNGNTIPLKYIVGADWELEKPYFEGFTYTEKPMPLDGDSILLSKPVADELGIRQGDSLIVEIPTATGQKNTGVFIAAGIVEDTNFFSYYKIFVSRLTLNRLAGLEEDSCSMIGFFLKNRSSVDPKRKALYTELQKRTETAPLAYDRDSYLDERQKASDTTVFLNTLPVYLSEVAQLIGAIDIASYLLFAMMLAIIMVSAAVTCRLILHERERETGTMRAIGFYEADLRRILQLEMAVMALFSMAAGFFLSLLINRILSFGSYSWFPGVEVFMQNGRLAARYQGGTLVVNIIATLCMLALAIGGPIYRNSRSPLPEMLSGGIH